MSRSWADLRERFEAAQRRLAERADELAEWLGESSAVKDIKAAAGEMGEVASLYHAAQLDAPARQPRTPAPSEPAPDLGEVF